MEAVGPGVTLYARGDEVFGMLPFPHGHGAHAQYVVAPTRVFVPKPEGSGAGRVSMLRRLVPARIFDKQIRKTNQLAAS